VQFDLAGLADGDFKFALGHNTMIKNSGLVSKTDAGQSSR
jgi:hypothetical protein